ncbi:hypothetical protein O3M35_002576 [Rhynocoris fuscipes]|uniref:Uncharacterized protein n=1 Tax=Rhynocoris fuscipes TaxID=488301 RepID=A0AAW1CPW7_9HEMI
MYIVLTVIELCVGSREVQDIIGTFSILITAGSAIIRALRFLAKKKEIVTILDRLETLRLKMLNDEENKHTVIDAENIGRKILASIFISLNSFPISSFVWATFCDYLLDFKETHMVLKVWVPWSRENALVHVLTNALLSLLTIPCGAFFSAIHFLELSFTLYTSAYIKTLQNNLINKGIRNEGIYEHHKVIIQLIKDHNKILSGIKYFETQISPLMPCGFGYAFIKVISVFYRKMFPYW